MKKIFSLSCVLAGCCIFFKPASAQVPGYMGKRFAINYDPQFMYAFLQGHFDFHNNGSLEYVTSLKHAVGVRYGFSNLKDEYEYEQVIYDSYGYYDYETIEADMKVKVHTGSIYVKFFNKRQGYIAPAGGYSALGLMFIRSKGVMSQAVNYQGEAFQKGDVFQTDTNIAIHFAKGRQIIIADRLILNMAAHVNLPLIYRFGGTDDEVHARATLSSIFRVNIGLGFLAF